LRQYRAGTGHWRDDKDSRLALLSGNVQNVIDIFRIRFGKPRQEVLLPVREESEAET
jgi:hypothetical protein